jgi:3',5'-cyclic AMP phosphodiesterase CpdA
LLRDFTFVQITDHHLGPSEHSLRKGFLLAYGFRAVLKDIAAHWADKIDFIVSTGDIVSGGTPTEYANVCRMLKLGKDSAPPGPQRVSIGDRREVPMYFIPGNHDDRSQFCRGLFDRDCAHNPLHLAFRHKGVHFVAPDWGPEEPDGTKPATRYYRFVDGGGVAPDTTADLAKWLADATSDNEPTIILSHYAPLVVENVWDERQVPRSIERFWDVVKERNNVMAIVCGHVHQTFEAHVGAVPVLGLAATCFQHILYDGEYVRAILPPQYRVVEMKDGGLKSTVYTVELPAVGTNEDF